MRFLTEQRWRWERLWQTAFHFPEDSWEKDKAERVENILWKIIHIDAAHMKVDMDEIISAIHKDKKQIGKELTAVLMKDDDEACDRAVDVKRDEIEAAVKYVFEKLQSGRLLQFWRSDDFIK